MEHPSRRSFLGMSSVALATAAFAGLTANAQEKASTQKAEHDHSSSDPGPENKVLLGANQTPTILLRRTTATWYPSGIPSIW
jgi:oxalate decarboxylase